MTTNTILLYLSLINSYYRLLLTSFYSWGTAKLLAHILRLLINVKFGVVTVKIGSTLNSRIDLKIFLWLRRHPACQRFYHWSWANNHQLTQHLLSFTTLIYIFPIPSHPIPLLFPRIPILMMAVVEDYFWEGRLPMIYLLVHGI